MRCKREIVINGYSGSSTLWIKDAARPIVGSMMTDWNVELTYRSESFGWCSVSCWWSRPDIPAERTTPVNICNFERVKVL